jgi:succinate dehydrogenase flavin-adding protein (antitoxin of CptAB toxin-antitoxin module)
MNRHKVTVFRSIIDTDTPFHRDVMVVLDRIKNGSSKDLVTKIRKEKDKTERNNLKKNLPSICFSGEFTKRKDDALVQHSGLLCIDLDDYESVKKMNKAKDDLSKSKYTYAVFVSPSGNGLKLLVRIPADVQNHKNYFNSLEKHVNSPHFDTTSKNVSRVCYESYDPTIYINENAELWDKIDEEEHADIVKQHTEVTIPITDENKIVDILVRWWSKKYPMNEGKRNENAYILAAAFNDFGVQRSLAEYVLNQYADKSFPSSEIKITIDSAYSKTQNFGTKVYEDTDKMNMIRSKIRRGVPRKEVRSEIVDEGIDPKTVEAVLGKIEDEAESQKFWTKTDRGVVKIVHFLFKLFLEDNGFYKYCPEGGNNYVFVRVTNNLIDHASEKEIKDFILNYLMNLDDISVYNYFADNTRFFKEEFLSMLATVDIHFIEDTKEEAYLYYRNCAVRIDRGGVTEIDYIDLGGYVWNEHIIDRNFVRCDSDECDYKQFIRNICADDTSRVRSMESTIGFLLHGYKNHSYCPAVVLNDEVITDNPEGGTGKGLFMNALSKMKKLVTIDGKSFTFESSFAYQLVSADTQVLVFDDVRKHFDFERLFSVVTEGLTLEKKNKDAIKIPFSKSPKIAITTNYAIKGSGNSFERRKWELELHQFYCKDFTPFDEFGKLMFGDWDEDEWCQFDNYMIGCLQGFLETGLVQSQFVNLEIRKLSAQTCHEFIEWCGLIDGAQPNQSLVLNVKLNKQALYYEFVDEFPDFGPKAKMTISRTKFYRWLTHFGEFKYGMKPLHGRDANGRWVEFIKKEITESTIEMDF